MFPVSPGKQEVQSDGTEQRRTQNGPGGQLFNSQKLVVDDAQKGDGEQNHAPVAPDDAPDQHGGKHQGKQDGPEADPLQKAKLPGDDGTGSKQKQNTPEYIFSISHNLLLLSPSLSISAL